MEEKINLSLFEDFFGFYHQLIMQKSFLILVQIKTKKIVAEAKDIISDLKDRIEQMSGKEKKYKNADETSEIINKTIDYNNDAQNCFHHASKIDKKNQNQRLKKILQIG